jgi:hypothetical protein
MLQRRLGSVGRGIRSTQALCSHGGGRRVEVLLGGKGLWQGLELPGGYGSAYVMASRWMSTVTDVPCEAVHGEVHQALPGGRDALRP